MNVICALITKKEIIIIITNSIINGLIWTYASVLACCHVRIKNKRNSVRNVLCRKCVTIRWKKCEKNKKLLVAKSFIQFLWNICLQKSILIIILKWIFPANVLFLRISTFFLKCSKSVRLYSLQSSVFLFILSTKLFSTI